MAVVVSCRTPRGRTWQAHVRGRARRIMRVLDLAGRELSVSLVGDDEMHALNLQYRRRDRPTDVLAFALDDDHAAVDGAAFPGKLPAASLLGDVVISIDTAAEQARQRSKSVEDTLDELLVHGVLHLIGYDHERSPAEARRMFRKARQVERALDDDRVPVGRRRP